MADLLLNENNLYRRGKILVLPDQSELLVRDSVKMPGAVHDKYHTVKSSDTLDKLAFQYYAEFVPDASKYWWVIADANTIENPLYLVDWVGKTILIPNILNAKLKL